MASEVNRQNISAEDFSLLSGGYPWNLLTSACGLRRLFPYGVAAVWLHQTANQGQSRPVFRLDQPPAGPLACAFEKHAFPTSALQIVAIALRRAVGVRCQLDARAAAGQGRPGPIVRQSSRAAPGSNQTDEVGNVGAWVPHGIIVPNEPFRAAPSVALVPGVPPLGRVAPRHGRRSSFMV